MSAPHASLLLALLAAAPALANPADEAQALEDRSAELEARAEELEARAEELETLFELLEDQRDAVDELRIETEAIREEATSTTVVITSETDTSNELDNKLRHKVNLGERVAIGDVVIEAGEEVEEVVSVGGNVDVFGRVRSDATSFGGTVHVHEGGEVDGNAIAIGGHVVVDDGAKVGGKVPLTATGSLSIDLDEEPEPENRPGTFGRLLHEIYSHIIFMLSFAGVGVLTIGLFPNRVARIAQAIQERPVRVAVLGGFVNLMLTAATFFMAITIIGLPVAALLGLFLALAWLFGFVGLCQAIGDRLPFEHKPHGRWLAFLVGVVVVTFVSALGLLGTMTVFAASVVGMGAAFHTRLGGTV